jgi:hypothetical protein
LLDQRVGAVVFDRRGQQLIGVIVAEIEPLHGDPGVVLRPGLDLPLGVVGVILLRDEVLVRVGGGPHKTRLADRCVGGKQQSEG